MKAILAQKEASAREEELAEQAATEALQRKEKEQQEATARVTGRPIVCINVRAVRVQKLL